MYHNPMVGSPNTGAAPMSGYPQTQVPLNPSNPSLPGPKDIDGTPLRVAVFAIAAGAGLWLLRQGGFRFNITTSAGVS